MRLTVRTLLAWIDGLLEPGDQASLGEKVRASGVAPALVERVHDVVARPGLSAPPSLGRGLADDPNTAAEFLDNALDADRLEAFERVCVESDLHLADVAACHRLLAELSREPAAIEPMSAAAARRILETATKRLDPLTAAAVAVSSGGAPRSTGAASTPKRPQVRRAPVAAWISAVAALALLALLGGFFVWSISRSARRIETQDVAVAAAVPVEPSQDAQQPPDPKHRAEEHGPDDAVAIPAANAGEAPPTAGRGPVGSGPDAEIQPAPVAAAMPSAPDASPAPAPVVPQAQVDPPPPAAPPAIEQRVPSGDALAIVASPIMAAPPAAATAQESVPGDASDAGERSAAIDPADVARAGGPLLRRDAAAGETTWMLRSADAPLIDREDLLAPPWCHPAFVVAGLTIRLEPCSRAVLTIAADGTPCLEMVFGRAVVSGAAPDARLGVIAGGLRGTLSGVMRQPAGIELVLDRAPGQASSTSRRAVILAGAAEKVWRQAVDDGHAPLAGLAPEALLPARAAIAWSDHDPAAATIMPPTAEPEWIRSTGGGDRIERSAARALADVLAGDDATAIDDRLRRLAADRRAENRMIAAATLALLGDYGELVTLLGAERPQAVNETQWAALERMTVPLAIARGDNSAAALAEAFRAAGPPGTGDTLMAIARGFSDAELAEGAAAALVDALDDGSLAVRRAAIRSLLEIVKPDQRHRATYRADRPDALRDDGVGWWRTQLEQGRIRRGGVPPPPAPAVPQVRDDE